MAEKYRVPNEQYLKGTVRSPQDMEALKRFWESEDSLSSSTGDLVKKKRSQLVRRPSSSDVFETRSQESGEDSAKKSGSKHVPKNSNLINKIFIETTEGLDSSEYGSSEMSPLSRSKSIRQEEKEKEERERLEKEKAAEEDKNRILREKKRREEERRRQEEEERKRQEEEDEEERRKQEEEEEEERKRLEEEEAETKKNSKLQRKQEIENKKRQIEEEKQRQQKLKQQQEEQELIKQQLQQQKQREAEEAQKVQKKKKKPKKEESNSDEEQQDEDDGSYLFNAKIEFTGDRDSNYLFKLVTIGDSAVGKSSILERWSTDEFSKDMKSTISVDTHMKTYCINNEIITVNLWDTAGQERFRAITAQYYRGANGVIIVFDLTKRSTFESVEKWVSDVAAVNDTNMQLLLIGNKKDLQKNRMVKRDEAIQFAKKYGMNYIETSAKDGRNCNKAISNILEEIYKVAKKNPKKYSAQEESKKQVPKSQTIVMTPNQDGDPFGDNPDDKKREHNADDCANC